jgi:hypothetical protein
MELKLTEPFEIETNFKTTKVTRGIVKKRRVFEYGELIV